LHHGFAALVQVKKREREIVRVFLEGGHGFADHFFVALHVCQPLAQLGEGGQLAVANDALRAVANSCRQAVGTVECDAGKDLPLVAKLTQDCRWKADFSSGSSVEGL
jgi:hypothetical protein